MEHYPNVTVTSQNDNNTHTAVTGFLALSSSGEYSCLTLYKPLSASETLKKKADAAVGVLRENPGTAVRGAVTAIGIGLGKSVLSAITHTNYAPVRVNNEALRDMQRQYTRKLTCLSPRTVWSMPLKHVIRLECISDQAIVGYLLGGGAFLMTFEGPEAHEVCEKAIALMTAMNCAEANRRETENEVNPP